MVTTAHQNASGMDLKKEFSLPASAKYTADENSTTPANNTTSSTTSTDKFGLVRFGRVSPKIARDPPPPAVMGQYLMSP